MKRLFALTLLATAAGLFSACSHLPIIGHKEPGQRPPKENSHIATQVETEFRQRWLEKRIGELVGQGVAPDTARIQAGEEFDRRFAVTHAAQQ